MPGLATVETYAAKLADAVNNSNWEVLPNHLERIKQIFLGALVRNERELALAVAKAISDAAALLRTRSGKARKLDAAAIAWMLAADGVTASLGLRLLPAGDLTEEKDSEARNAQDEILNLLAVVGCSLSTNEIVSRVAKRQETVSRALSGLRAQLAVRTIPAGRARKHRITAQGRTLLAKSLSMSPKGQANDLPSLAYCEYVRTEDTVEKGVFNDYANQDLGHPEPQPRPTDSARVDFARLFVMNAIAEARPKSETLEAFWWSTATTPEPETIQAVNTNALQLAHQRISA